MGLTFAFAKLTMCASLLLQRCNTTNCFSLRYRQLCSNYYGQKNLPGAMLCVMCPSIRGALIHLKAIKALKKERPSWEHSGFHLLGLTSPPSSIALLPPNVLI